MLPFAALASLCLPSTHVPRVRGVFSGFFSPAFAHGARDTGVSPHHQAFCFRRPRHVLSLDGFAPRACGVRNRANAHACPAPAGKSVDGEPKMATLESFLKNRPAKEESKPMNFGLRGFAPSALADRISDASANLSTLKQGILGVGADSAAE
jgi:hypothetical protein